MPTIPYSATPCMDLGRLVGSGIGAQVLDTGRVVTPQELLVPCRPLKPLSAGHGPNCAICFPRALLLPAVGHLGLLENEAAPSWGTFGGRTGVSG